MFNIRPSVFFSQLTRPHPLPLLSIALPRSCPCLTAGPIVVTTTSDTIEDDDIPLAYDDDDSSINVVETPAPVRQRGKPAAAVTLVIFRSSRGGLERNAHAVLVVPFSAGGGGRPKYNMRRSPRPGSRKGGGAQLAGVFLGFLPFEPSSCGA